MHITENILWQQLERSSEAKLSFSAQQQKSNSRVSLDRYIATNFPKTMALTDGNGRTALHYAATVNDSGDIYRTLEELGSMTTKEDKVSKLGSLS